MSIVEPKTALISVSDKRNLSNIVNFLVKKEIKILSTGGTYKAIKEITPDENRVAATPQTVKDLIKSGLTIRVESGAGDASYISDGDYKNVGAEIFPDPSSILKDADIILKVAPATKEEIDKLRHALSSKT